MNFSHFSGDASQFGTDSIIIGHFEDQPLSGSAAAVDKVSGGLIHQLINDGDLAHKSNKIRQLYHLQGVTAKRILVIGLGKKEKFDRKAYIKAIKDCTSKLIKSPAMTTLNCLPEMEVTNADSAWKIRHAVVAMEEAAYNYTHTKEKPEITGLDSAALCDGSEVDHAEAITFGVATARGVNRARELGNLPPNICNPDFLAATAGDIAGSYSRVSLEVLNRNEMEELGMGALLGVARGSSNDPRLIVMRYNGADDQQKPHVLVGKGITFDSGGISLKPGAGMDEMKYDMCGAASVIGTIEAVAEMNLAINLVVIVPAVENMPDGNSYRPGDVLTSMSGKTIEVLNTDAEGRLILCDALSYGIRFEPASIIDVATLTGACVIALGEHATGLLSKQDDLADALLEAGKESCDMAWRLPLWDEYQAQLDTPFADMANVGGRPAGTITAACFLSRFTEDQNWAHLDIAGSGWKSGSNRDATGRPVKLLTQYLMNQSG